MSGSPGSLVTSVRMGAVQSPWNDCGNGQGELQGLAPGAAAAGSPLPGGGGIPAESMCHVAMRAGALAAIEKARAGLLAGGDRIRLSELACIAGVQTWREALDVFGVFSLADQASAAAWLEAWLAACDPEGCQ